MSLIVPASPRSLRLAWRGCRWPMRSGAAGYPAWLALGPASDLLGRAVVVLDDGRHRPCRGHRRGPAT